MKKILPISTIIAFLVLFIFKNSLFRNNRDNKISNFSYASLNHVPDSIDIAVNNIDTTDILKNLCQRAVSNNVTASTGLEITNYIPCSWNEDFASEKKGAASAYSKADGNGIVEMALLINEIPYTFSPQQRKEFFSLEKIKKVAEEAKAISYRKYLLSGFDCQEIIFKKDNLAGSPGGTSYSIHFETIFKNKYITLSYSVGYYDTAQSRIIFYQYLPVFRTLSQKFKISN